MLFVSNRIRGAGDDREINGSFRDIAASIPASSKLIDVS